MNSAKATRKTEQREEGRFYWIFEILVLATVTPALFYAIFTLNDLPLV